MRARMRPAWCYLVGIRATDTFDMRARAARVASWDRNIKTSIDEEDEGAEDMRRTQKTDSYTV